MADLWVDVDAALSEVPINLVPLIDDTTFKDIEASLVYNQAGLVLVWNFITCAGAFAQTAVTPTDTAGLHDWVNQGNGLYTIEIPASGGTINNDTEGFGWFTGVATGVLPWRGPVIGFRSAGLNDSLIETGTGLATAAEVIATLEANQLEGTITWKQAMLLAIARFGGLASGGGTTEIIFQNPAGTKNRITLTVDANGNVSASAFDFT